MSEYRNRVNEMPTFEEYAAARETEYIKVHGENFDECFDNPAQAKKTQMMNYKTEYLMELAIREGNAKATEDEAERLTREYNEKMAALGAKHHIENSSLDNAYLGLLKAMREDSDSNGNAQVRF